MALPVVYHNNAWVGGVLTATPGSIAWDQFSIQYKGETFLIPAASTASRWVWWEWHGGGANSVIMPGAAIPDTLTDDDLVLLKNQDGLALRVQSANFVDGELIVDGTILADAIGTNEIKTHHLSSDAIDADHLTFNNAFGTALEATDVTGTTLTGALIQTRKDADAPVAPDTGKRGIKLGFVDGEEGLFAYSDTGKEFIRAVPAEGVAVIAGKMTSQTLTVSSDDPLKPPGSSLGGVTEIATGGKVRLSGGTTAPKSAPVPSIGYDTQQFTDDGKWPNRVGWAYSSNYPNYYFTARRDPSSKKLWLERWNTSGTLNFTSLDNLVNIDEVGGVATDGPNNRIYVITYYAPDNQWWLHRFSATTLTWQASASFPVSHFVGTRDVGLFFDLNTNEIITAQARTSDDHTYFSRYTVDSAGTGVTRNTVVSTTSTYGLNIGGSFYYGTADFGLPRYVVSGKSSDKWYVFDASTLNEQTDQSWPSGSTQGKVGLVRRPGGDFAVMHNNGILRLYTNSWTSRDQFMKKWVSNTLAKGASPHTYQTDQSPRASIIMPKRSKLIVATSAIPSGTDPTKDPDRVRVYIGTDLYYTITQQQITGTVGTLTLSGSSHLFKVGQQITVSGGNFDVRFSGTRTVTAVTATTVSVTVTSGTNIALSSCAGVAERTGDPGASGMMPQVQDQAGVTQFTYSQIIADTPANTGPPASNNFPGGAGSLVEAALNGFTIDSSSNGSIGSGTFRDSVDARVTAIAPGLTMTSGDVGTGAFRDSVDARVTAKVKGGRFTGTTDANGNVTVTHGMGVTPSAVTLTQNGSPTRLLRVESRTTTTFVVLVANASNVAVASGAADFLWVAVA